MEAQLQPARVRSHGRRGERRAQCFGDLAAIYEPGVDVVVLERRPSAELQDDVRRLAEEGVDLSLRLRAISSVEVAPALFGHEALVRDLSELAALAMDLFEAREIGLRLRSLSAPMCPRFHVDRVVARMVCAYQGPGTQWVPDGSIDRARLGGASDDSALLAPGTRPLVVPTFAVALLKGDAFPDHQGHGVVHRSPPADRASVRRLFLSIDFLEF
jgi:hypothetical protein